MSAYEIISGGVLRLYLLFLLLLLGGSNGGIVDVEPYMDRFHNVSVYLAKWIRPVSISYDDNFLSHRGVFYCLPLPSPC